MLSTHCAQSMGSFVCIFILVWWIWASQVAYNARFKKFNWAHRIFLFFHLLIFCAIAAFTHSFDIGNGIADDSQTQRRSKLLAQQLPSNINTDWLADVADRVPRLNVRGISMTMVLSRVLLLVQYSYGPFLISSPPLPCTHH